MAIKKTSNRKGVSRRQVLKGAAATAGLVAGSGVITGFPNIVIAGEITLRYAGTAVNQHTQIAKKVKEDLGINLQYIPLTSDDVVKTAVTQPNRFDILDSEYWMLKKIVPSGNLQGMDTNKIKLFDKITTVFTKGEVNGKKIGDQGTAPIKVQYLEKRIGKKFASEPTQWMTLIPTVYNADTLGIRPDLIGSRSSIGTSC